MNKCQKSSRPANFQGLKSLRGTFTPSVSEGFQDSKRPVVVSGLDRFFELKNLALKQRQERLFKLFRSQTCCKRVIFDVLVLGLTPFTALFNMRTALQL